MVDLGDERPRLRLQDAAAVGREVPTHVRVAGRGPHRGHRDVAGDDDGAARTRSRTPPFVHYDRQR